MDSSQITVGQYSLLVGSSVTILYWIIAEIQTLLLKRKHGLQSIESRTATEIELGDVKIHKKVSEGVHEGRESLLSMSYWNSIFRCFLCPYRYVSHLRRGSEFIVILVWFYLCDVIRIFPSEEYKYDRDMFWFIYVACFVVGALTWRRIDEKSQRRPLLNRNQTEEWRGFMQIGFIAYHYFHAGIDVYNLIRIFIAGYVWMTGFGHFSYFWIRKDYSFTRLLKMLFRLNFLVLFLVMVTNNEYMIYYICALHTTFFLLVYVGMGIFPNSHFVWWKFIIKQFLVFFFCFVVWDLPPGSMGIVFKILFYPFLPILKQTWDPKLHRDIMHEWHFRSSLDHYAAAVGMVSAYTYPFLDQFLREKLDKQPKWVVYSFNIFFGAVLAVGLIIVVPIDKYTYNRFHPYFSWIFILSYYFVRNGTVYMREHASTALMFIGKITLETYLSQFHILLNHNATQRIVMIPHSTYLNALLCTTVWILLSREIYFITQHLSLAWFTKDLQTNEPQSSRVVFSRLVVVFVMFVLAFGGGVGLKMLSRLWNF